MFRLKITRGVVISQSPSMNCSGGGGGKAAYQITSRFSRILTLTRTAWVQVCREEIMTNIHAMPARRNHKPIKCDCESIDWDLVDQFLYPGGTSFRNA
jgi:hypothetical protein